MARFLKQLIEQGAWQSRSAPLAAMIGTGLVVFFMVYLAAVDGRSFLDYLNQSTEPGLTAEMRLMVRLEITIAVIKVLLDVYLLLVSLVIFAQSLNEFFGRKMGAIEGWEFAARLLLISSLDGLKTRLIGLALARLVVGFFQRALRLEPESLPGLLSSAMVILLVGAALFLSQRGRATGRQPKHHS